MTRQLTPDEHEEQSLEIGDVAQVDYRFKDGIVVSVFDMDFADVAEEAAQSYQAQVFAALKRKREAERPKGKTTVDMGKIVCPHCGGTSNYINAMIAEESHVTIGVTCRPSGVSFEVEIRTQTPTQYDADDYIDIKVHEIVNWEHQGRRE